VSALWQLSASELLAGYRSRAFSPVEVVDALADRIAALESLGAFNTLCLDRAREEARAAESAYAPGGSPDGLTGVPFAAKDLFDSAGVRTTYGSRMFADNVPDTDAAAVAALRGAGGILIGKTQTHEFAWGVTSVNEAMGSSLNPWQTDLVPGGSSGGSAVALAARLVPLTLGSDTGGSIRIPAAFCGVMGLKPTFGRLDTTGVWPLAPSLDHVGPLARTPDDLELLFPPSAERRADRLDGETVVVCRDLHLSPLTPAVARVYDQTVETLEQLGARIVEHALPGAERFDEVFGPIQLNEALRVHREAGLFPERADEYGHDVRRRLEYAAALDPDGYVLAIAERERVRSALGELLCDGGLLVTPVSAVPPAPSADREATGAPFRAAVMAYTVPHDVAGLPSCAVRAGFDDDGLPIGMQIAAAQWREADVLRAAGALFRATPEIQSRWPQIG
jgi:aspartyl-tRNA(Asn)/glutamyl-tRNA(Gln) amidotransferase subunit A